MTMPHDDPWISPHCRNCDDFADCRQHRPPPAVDLGGYCRSIDYLRKRVLITVGPVVTAYLARWIIDDLIATGVWTLPCVMDLSQVTSIEMSLQQVDHLIVSMAVASRRLPTRGPVIVVAPTPALRDLAQSIHVCSVGYVRGVSAIVRRHGDVEAAIVELRGT